MFIRFFPIGEILIRRDEIAEVIRYRSNFIIDNFSLKISISRLVFLIVERLWFAGKCYNCFCDNEIINIRVKYI